MLFNKYETKFIKTNKNDVIKGIKSNSLSDIFVMEPVDKSNTKSVKLELDKLVRSGEVSIVIMKHFILLLIIFFIYTLGFTQKTERDTIYFRYDKTYLRTHKSNPGEYYFKDIEGNGLITYFAKLKTVDNLKPKKILSLKHFIRSSKAYHKKKPDTINQQKLLDIFEEYIIFLVQKIDPTCKIKLK